MRTDTSNHPGSGSAARRNVEFGMFVLAVGALFVTIAILIAFVTYFHRAGFNSDDAVVNTLAESMWSQGRLFPEGWINNNGDLLIPSGALVVAPLLRWFPNGFGVHAVAGVLAVIWLLGSLWSLLRTLEIPTPVAVLMLTVAASGFSTTCALMVYAQTTYVWWVAGFFSLANLVIRFRQRAAICRRARSHIAIVFLLVFVISFANPARVLLMMVLPLYVLDRSLACAIHENSKRGATGRRFVSVLGLRDPLVVWGFVTASVLTTLLYLGLRLAGVTEAVYGAAGLHWDGWAGVMRHATTFVTGWGPYLGTGAHGGGVGSAAALFFRCFRWCIAAVLTGYSLVAIATAFRMSDPVRRAVALATAAAFLPIFALYITFSPLAVEGGTIRYFSVSIFLMLIVGSFPLSRFLTRSPLFGRAMFAAVGVVFVAVSAQRFLPAGLLFHSVQVQQSTSATIKLAELLRSEGLEWGYATWWNAGATTVLADSTVHVVPIELRPTGIGAFQFMVLKSWYEPSSWKGRSFLALARGEVSEQGRANISVDFGDPERVIETPDYIVMVYGHNIASDFSCPNGMALNRSVPIAEPSIRIAEAHLEHATDSAATPSVFVRLSNRSAMTVSGIGRFPISIGLQLANADGTVVRPDWLHIPLACPMFPGDERIIRVALPAAPAGVWNARVDIVQEGVAWFHDHGVAAVDLPFTVQADKHVTFKKLD